MVYRIIFCTNLFIIRIFEQTRDICICYTQGVIYINISFIVVCCTKRFLRTRLRYLKDHMYQLLLMIIFLRDFEVISIFLNRALYLLSDTFVESEKQIRRSL